MGRALLSLLLLAAARLAAQPTNADILPLAAVKAGARGEVWTVFQGSKPEPFSVEVTGIIENALGPGKSIILCRLTDPRVQNMGAVAGMSGSPLYIDGRFAGALSYQLQRFETVRFAGFTPAADMAEVSDRVGSGLPGVPAQDSEAGAPAVGAAAPADSSLTAMMPVFALGGVSPRAAALMAPRFEALGIRVVSLGGSVSQGGAAPVAARPALSPGDAVAVALTTGDITMAGTGTVSRVDGNRIVAFGHPMLGLGDVQMPMCAADVVTILPSSLESFKVANIGPVIGCISQDRLSAVSGLMGPGPQMTDVEVVAGRQGGARRTLRFQVVRDRRIAPMIMLTGVVEAVYGSNDSDPGEGFRIESTVTYASGQQLTRRTLYPGAQGFTAGLIDFLVAFSNELQNPFEKVVPARVTFRVEQLDENPAVTVEQFQVSRATLRAGDTLQATLAWRDFQGAEEVSSVDIPVDPSWTGKTLEVIVTPGRVLDEITGHSRQFRPGQLRSFEAYLDAERGNRADDGLYVAVVERSSLFFDQAASSPDVPASIQRIASAADGARYQRRDALVPLWEQHVLAGKAAFTDFHRTVRVVE